MNEYRLIEFNSEKKESKVVTNNTKLQQILVDFYKDKLDRMFDENGNSRGFISIFINSKQISSIKNITLNNYDEICVVTSISGG